MAELIELVVAFVIAIPIALGITGIVMGIAAHANYTVERWDYYCVVKK